MSNRSTGFATGNTCVAAKVFVFTSDTPPRMYPDTTTHSDRGTGTRSSGLGMPQMNWIFPSGSQPPGLRRDGRHRQGQKRCQSQNSHMHRCAPF